jgi:hypothetical protein
LRFAPDAHNGQREKAAAKPNSHKTASECALTCQPDRSPDQSEYMQSLKICIVTATNRKKGDTGVVRTMVCFIKLNAVPCSLRNCPIGHSTAGLGRLWAKDTAPANLLYPGP